MANGWQEEKPPSEWDWIRSDVANWFRGVKEWIFGPPDDTEEGEDGVSLGETARAVTRWHSPRARRLRIAWWRTFRPWGRWKRRHPALWGLLATGVVLGALFFTTKFFLELSLPAAGPVSAESLSPTVASAGEGAIPAVELQFAPTWQDRKAIPSSLSLSKPPEVIWREINETFAAGDFAGAEKAYRQFQIMHRSSPMLFFRLLLCLVAQDKADEARTVAAKLPRPEAAVGPAAFYARAVVLWLEGEPAEGAQLIREANARFPLVASDYVRVMSQFARHFPAIETLLGPAGVITSG